MAVDLLDRRRSPAGAASAARLRAFTRDPALRAVWSAFWRSRLLIWVVGCGAVLAYGVSIRNRTALDPGHYSSTLGSVGNVLAAPALRWDAVWYLQIAHDGYRTFQETGFFPLYPLLLKIFSLALVSPVIAGIVVSLLATFIGLVVVQRLTELEFGSEPANLTVKLIAFGPFAFFLSAIYTEGLFLALTAGTFYAARRSRWLLAGILGAFAAMTRVTGVLLMVPMVMLFLYGPRDDATPLARPALPAQSRAGIALQRLLPRYRPGPQLLWALLIPAGAGVFFAFTASKGYGAFATFHAQHVYWAHQFTGPFTAVWRGFGAAWHELREQLAGHGNLLAYRTPAMLQAVVLVVSVVGLIGVARRLPLAYAAYVFLGLLIPLSSPTVGVGDPLHGLDRYASMIFPLFMWVAAWASERRMGRPLLIVSTVLLVGFTVQFATWHLVGSIPS